MQLFLSTRRTVLRYIVKVSLTPSCANSKEAWDQLSSSPNLYFQNPLYKPLGSDKLNVFTEDLKCGGLAISVWSQGVFECLEIGVHEIRSLEITQQEAKEIGPRRYFLVALNKTIVGRNLATTNA